MFVSYVTLVPLEYYIMSILEVGYGVLSGIHNVWQVVL